jgi:hypothetical protein
MFLTTEQLFTPSRIDAWESPFYHKEVFQVLRGVKQWHPTGSYHICSPQVVDTDKDFVVLVEDITDAQVVLEIAGYKYSGDETYEVDSGDDAGTFTCFRKDSTNLIVTANEEFYNLWLEATALAKAMNLLNKEQRIRLFQYVLYGNTKLKGE